MNPTTNQTRRTFQTAEASESISHLNKGLGAMHHALSPKELPSLGWELLREDLSLPAAVLYEDKLAHNLQWMQEFVTTYGMKLAPHGKTTMAPKLFARQLEAGAWGITLATAHQTRVAYEHGVRRVLMANQLVGKQNMTIIAALLEDPEFEYFCLVDSAEQVELLGQFFRDRGQRLQVLFEVGVDGGRTGVRDQQQLHALVASLSHWREHLLLCGVEVFEGVLKDEIPIRQLLQRTVDVAYELAQKNLFDRTPIILSGAGSAWYDLVAEVFSRAEIEQPIEVVLRPGCYLTHDVGVYRTAQQRIQSHNPIAQRMNSSLLPALQLWAYVQAVPEKEKAIVALGKRDAAFDAGLPVPALHYRPGRAAPIAAPSAWQLTSMMDQHAFLHIAEGDDIRVGDMIAFDISHPCLTFDKWRYLSILDSAYRVIDVVQTFF
jgi:D-serine dehydratase